MLLHILIIAASIVGQAPPPNPACALLTPAQLTALVGGARAIPVSTNAMGSTCMLQSGDKVITVLIVNASSADGATRQFESKQRIVSGQTLTGWTVPAYLGTQKPAAVALGILKGQTLTEVKVLDETQTIEALSAKLKTVMTEVAARK